MPARPTDATRSLIALHGSGADLAKVALPLPVAMDSIELVRLYHALESAERRGECRAFQFASAEHEEPDLAFAVAWAGAALLGRRTLFIDASAGMTRIGMPHSLQDVATGQAPIESAVAKQNELTLFVAALQSDPDRILAVRAMEDLFAALRGVFDMILVAPPPVLTTPLATVLAGLLDGSVLVLRAGSDRSVGAARARALLEGSGHPVLGAVMTGEKDPRPHWLRRWV